ncbi:MAG TPA: class I SAM-dependent methyltransferase [Pseudomonadota bacterium]|nr:class I SAM-dependent methyltransferase [Pseudomonadota bacterium]HNK44008.1 class I SAM-dependent methyltransferase [Pseudomonadota bacterium]HNN49863.1 class I SAM-dependent methyltransferase [Pseudomonadota bacterium]
MKGHGLPALASAWLQNVRRLMVPRPPWRADAEFDYYRVDPAELGAQLARQKAWQRQGHFVGLGVVQALGLLDRTRLAGKRVLEIGAGECMLSQALLVAGASEVWAVDAVPKQLWAAAASQPADGPLHCVIADAMDLPFSDGSFDFVVANLVIHHIRPLSRLLPELVRVLAPGGRLLALEPAPIVGLFVHDQTSDNEAPLWPQTVTQALADAGLLETAHQYLWLRLQTTRFGPLSPSYRVSGARPGQMPAQLGLRRSLRPSALPGLHIDSGCTFAPLVEQQLDEIVACGSREGLLKKAE